MDEQLVVFLYLAALIVIVVGIYGGWWSLSSMPNYIPEVIMLSLIPLLIWGFRKRITQALRTAPSSSPRPLENHIAAPPDESANIPISERPIEVNTVQVEPIHHYNTRQELPFVDMLSIAKSTVEMSAVSFTILTLQHYEDVRFGINRGLKFTFLILDPNSQYVGKQTESYHATDDLKNQIEKAITRLCDLQKDYPDDVIIRTYDSLARYSITIIDRVIAENAWVRLERRPAGRASKARSSEAAYRKNDIGFFNQSKDEYDKIFKKSKIYHCPVTS